MQTPEPAPDEANTPNPLLQPWQTYFELPPFDLIEPDHFRPAFDAGLAENRAEIDAIAGSPEEPTFANTIEALERAGHTLDRVCEVFFNLAGSHTNEALQAIEREIAPVLSRHSSAISQNAALFGRIDRLWQERARTDLSPEQARVLERYHTSFVRDGAALSGPDKQRLAEISERLATLSTAFSQNVLADENAYTLVLDGEGDLAGLPDFVRAAAAATAADRGFPGKHVITASRSSIEPFLQFSARRDLREQAFRAWSGRGESGGATDNRAVIAEIVELRAEFARLLGFPNFAQYRVDDAMAKTPDAVLHLLRSVWGPARTQALAEQEALQDLVRQDGGNFDLAAWDWRYYAERRRKAEFDIDDAEIKPYLPLNSVIEAAFDTAQRLFGLTFPERTDLALYHPDARAFDVVNRAGEVVGLFIGDYFARSSKHGGAWMSAFRTQQKLSGDPRPIIINVMNFNKSDDGPTLLGFDEARTVFHEFGHALHGLLSDVTYPRISGTHVSRDFVEFPSQLYEHWLEQPEVLRRHARHHRTGEPMPEDLLKRLLAARRFNQGFATVEFLSSALVDFEAHLLADPKGFDASAFERATLSNLGMPGAMVMRHRMPHFGHVFGGGYSAAYYSYLWSEVLDADGFAAFEEAGDIFDPFVAQRLHDFVYSAGGKRDPAEAYQRFRGRLPNPDAVLRQRGLMDVASKSVEGAAA